MSRYFFNVYDGFKEADKDGTELEDWNAAQQHAIRLAAKILDDQAHRIALGELWHMEVTDEAGLSLFRVDFHVTPSPSLMHARAREGELP